MKPNRTLDQIRREGLAALRARLGVTGMVRFLQQFENGKGDYTAERRSWVDRVTLADIRAGAATRRTRKARKASRSIGWLKSFMD
jgi:hypothetical protein